MLNERLRRVTDLFIEGTEIFFGMDEKSDPILLWVAKLNSFEVEEARRDAAVKRGLRTAELSKDDNPEFTAIRASIASWSDDKLAEQRVEQQTQEIYLTVFNDIEADPGWREKVDIVRRGSTLLDDEGAAIDDPRRKELTETQNAYINEIRIRQEKAQIDLLADLKTESRTENIEAFIEAWRNRVTLDIFMQERRVTEIYYSLRDCQGKANKVGDKYEFDHSDCDHGSKMLANRSDVFELPENVIQRVVDALDGITVPARDAGNSGAPASSSGSSEQQSEAEESTPSIPEETSPGAATT